METPDMGMFDTSEPPRPLVPQAKAMENSVWGMASSSSFVHVFGFFTPVIVKVLSSLHHFVVVEGLAVLLGHFLAPVVHDEDILMIGDVLGEADGYGGVLLGVHAIVESYGIAGILATNAQPVAGGLVVGDVGVAAQRRAVVEVVPEHELVVALGAGGIHAWQLQQLPLASTNCSLP